MIPLKVIIAFVHFITAVYSQYHCITPNGEISRCIPIYSCPILFNVINHRNPHTVQFLRHSKCAYGPFVCCGSVAGYTGFRTTTTTTRPIRVYQQITQPPLIRPKPVQPKPHQRPILPSTSKSLEPKLHRNFNLLPSRDDCGQQSLQNKIFGGTEAGIDEFPWMALLRYRKNNENMGFRCGGMLINERYVLTAAHCVAGKINQFFGDIYQIRLGEHDINKTIDCQLVENQRDCNVLPQDADVEDIIFPSSYSDKSKDKYNDIALIRLLKPVKWSFFVQPICLPINGEKTAPGENMMVAGWGATENAISSNIKLKTWLPYVDDDECNRIYSRNPVKIKSTQFCAGGINGIDSCSGDSGGPIMNVLSDDETWYAEGIVSFGPSVCGTPGFPGVYTRISSYLNWILDNMKP